MFFCEYFWCKNLHMRHNAIADKTNGNVVFLIAAIIKCSTQTHTHTHTKLSVQIRAIVTHGSSFVRASQHLKLSPLLSFRNYVERFKRSITIIITATMRNENESDFFTYLSIFIPNSTRRTYRNFYDVQPDATSAAFIQQTIIFIDRPMMDTHHITSHRNTSHTLMSSVIPQCVWATGVYLSGDVELFFLSVSFRSMCAADSNFCA